MILSKLMLEIPTTLHNCISLYHFFPVCFISCPVENGIKCMGTGAKGVNSFITGDDKHGGLPMPMSGPMWPSQGLKNSVL